MTDFFLYSFTMTQRDIICYKNTTLSTTMASRSLESFVDTE